MGFVNQLVIGQQYLYGFARMGRKGERCRLLVIAKRMNSVAVEFDDGHQAVTSANALRKLPANYRPPARLF